MAKLDDLLKERVGVTNDGVGEQASPDRDIYEEEQKKIDEWGNEVKDQVSIFQQ